MKRMMCKYYANDDVICQNASCPYYDEICPVAAHQEVCKHWAKRQDAAITSENIASLLRNCGAKNCEHCDISRYSGCVNMLMRCAADMLEELLNGEKP